MTGNDGSVRAAKVKTKNGFTTRPIVKLYPLETVTSDNHRRYSFTRVLETVQM